MAIRNRLPGFGPGEPEGRGRLATPPRPLAIEVEAETAGVDRLHLTVDAEAPVEDHFPLRPADGSGPAPESTTPLLPVEKAPLSPTLDAPRPVTATNDTASAVEDGQPVVISVLNNDIGVAAVARINGIAVTTGSSITLQSGARVIVNSDGTLSYEVGTAFQSLGAGQTAQDVFSYAAIDGGGSPLAPEGVFNAAAINGTNGFVIHGAAAGDRSGYSVAGIGDVNGDGRDDLLIGALSADSTGRVDAGTSYVVYGRQGGFGQTLDLGALTAATGFSITGINAFDYSGASVRAAGDVNGDGLADFLIGAPWGEANQGANAGESYLVFGRAGGFGTSLDLTTLNGVNGVTFRGRAAGDGLGFAVSSAGDINGDGFDDLIVAAREADNNGETDAGASYVVFGRASGFGAAIDVTGLNGTNGFAILGADALDRSGYSVSGAGDVNGDGIDDLIIGAPQADPGGRANAGEAYVVFGRLGGFGASLDLGALNGVNGFTISGVAAGDHAGWSVSAAGDLNGDGRADMVIGALYADPGGRESAGATYVVFGQASGGGANLDLTNLPAALGFTITGTAARNLTGHSVASAGDINGDGIDDLLIGALYADGSGGTDAGETYVVFGRAGGFGNVLDLASLNGQTGFAVGGVAAGDFSGHSVSAAGDVNGDGFDDLIIGAPMASPSGRTNAGASYVLFGAANVTRFSNDATVTVTVTGVNDAPVITSNGGDTIGGYSIAENTLGPNTLTAFDPDAGSNLTFSIIGGADAALFTINAGVLQFINPPNFEAPADQNGDNVYDVIVQVSDGTATDTQTLSVTVTNANEAPVITSNGGGAVGGYSISENTLGPNPLTATDPDAGANLVFTIIGGADAALFTINAGVLQLINPPNFEAPADQNGDNVYEVIVQVSDGQLTDTQTINLTVTNANEAPVITSGGGGPSTVIPRVENSTTVTTVVAADPDAGSNLVFSILTGRDGARFVIDPATGVLTFAVAPDFETPTDLDGNNVYEVDVQVSDGQGGTDVQTIFVNVSGIPEAPTITSNGGGATGGYSVTENTLGPNTLTAFDPDAGSNLTFSIIGGADAALFTINAGVLQFINPPNFEAPADQNGDNVYDVIVRVSDGNLTDTQTLSVTVTNANEAPVITSNGGGAVGGYTISENTLGPNPLTATDPDAGANLVFTIIGGPDAALFTINAGVLQLINPPNFEAPADQNGDNVYQVIVQVSDGQLTDTQTINLTVTNANEAPVITSDGGGVNGTVMVAEGTRTATTVIAADPDAGAQITYSIVGGADSGRFTIDPATGVVAFVTNPDFEAPGDSNGDNNYDIIVQASDGVNSDTQNLRVTVTDAPEAAPPTLANFARSVTFNENTVNSTPQLLDSDVAFADPNGDLNGGSLTVSGLLAEDRLSVRNQGTSPGLIGLSGSSVTYGGVVIGTLAGGVGTTLTITFNAAATSTAVDALIQNLTYANVSDTPARARDLVINVTDAAGDDLGLGPLAYTERSGAADPFSGVDVGQRPFQAFADLDGDGDLDAVVGELYGTLQYLENTGTASAPAFSERTGTLNPFDGVNLGFNSTPSFADLDGDGDLDAMIGNRYGPWAYYENTGTATTPTFTLRTGAADPFNSVIVSRPASVDFVDLDGDGDLDAVINDSTSRFLYFENTGTATAANFTQRTGSANPFEGFYFGNGGNLSFADIDGDGDLDGAAANFFGFQRYIENTGTAQAPTFVERTGSANPFDVVNRGTYNSISLVDLDGDGAIDAVLSDNNGTLRYLELVSDRGQRITVNVTAQADPLSLSGVDSPITINEADPFVLIDNDVTLVDLGVGYGGGNLTITGLDPAELLSVQDVGNGPGQIGVVGPAIHYGGIQIGVIQAAPPAGSYIIQLFGAADRAAIEALVEALLIRSTSDIPVANHNLVLQITNSAGETTPAVSIEVQFTADILNGTDGDDTLSGLRGNDIISGYDGLDTLSGGVGDDRIFGDGGDDVLDGGDADDVLDGGSGLDTLNGGDGRDVLFGASEDDTLNGDASDDLLEGGDGNDILDGGSEDDRLLGDTGMDTLRGGDGLDRLSGGDDDDFLFGGSGHDILYGGIGVDDLQGEDGDDQLNGDGGDDRIDGGAGIDTAIFKGPFSSYTIQVITAGVVRVIGPEGDDLVLNCEFLQFDDQTINLSGPGNLPPRITSDGGGAEISVDVEQGETFVTTVMADDPELSTVIYSIAGGADAARFTIDAATGVLSFINPVDFFAPTDAGRDNTYDVVVSASDGQTSDLQSIVVFVQDPNNSPLPFTKGGGPEVCYAPDDVGGEESGPQVLPGLTDKAPLPAEFDGLKVAIDLFPPQDLAVAPSHRLGDTWGWQPSLTAPDDGFS